MCQVCCGLSHLKQALSKLVIVFKEKLSPEIHLHAAGCAASARSAR